MAIINMWPRKRSSHAQFEQLVQPHLQRLYKLAYRFAGQRDDAEDLVQDVLLKLYPRLEEMQAIEKLGPWLARVLYRHFIDRLRSQQRSPIQFIDDEQPFYESHVSDGLEPDDLLESELSQQSLQRALDQLNEDQRLLVLLHDVEGYSLPEINQLLDVSVGTIKSRLSRARSKLREILGKMEPLSDVHRVNG
ncbi:MAG: RNA polymerase sigma factor [Gammaproteobacteria bacterium]|nr:RNA polymerase sigma factor [Gammaproteobacteria bacterium]